MRLGRTRTAPALAGRWRGERSWTWLLAVPLLAVMFAVFLYPAALLLVEAFTDFRPPQEGGLDNFQWFVESEANRTILVRTFIAALAVTVVCLLMSYPYAYIAAHVGSKARWVLLITMLLPYFSSITMRNFSWVVILGREGLINDTLGALGLGKLDLLGTAVGATIGMAHVQMPLMAIPLYAVLRGIDTRLVLAAQSLGATPIRAFLRVYLPLSVRGVVAGSLLTFVSSLGFYITPAILGSPQEAMLSQVIALQVQKFLAWGRASALSIVLVVCAIAVLAFLAGVGRRQSGAARGGGA